MLIDVSSSFRRFETWRWIQVNAVNLNTFNLKPLLALFC